ncbi:dTDP-4-dehydrorhamnose 3,5-epimerase [Rhodoferax saidenbachensis]|uniref:dTDP-4-dehydrorhamnose 3,5-epimerase n=1 Tax=Rhodoferax saidenbachensis TaxID=1484693 RepID=A0ABU1ZTJ8_9BURK|nr:dTDP-4-dehydrorhamnose 3,5-epimerase [Rhodoferax saidenbachensis]MDR7308884.1 dTDP-4-dehydrorhamnose 3,5-epimerase [Rhodoferax saidenbachensis]
MSRFTRTETPLAGLLCLERQVLGDARGFLTRLFCAEELADAGWTGAVAQVNHTYTAQRGVVRGLHFQHPPHAETKLVTCIRGAVWDVAVDVRAGSPTFLQWHAVELSAQNHRSLLIPQGFAHGFQTLTEDCEMVYLHSAPYVAQAEAGLSAQDPRLAIVWPLPIAELSPRDAQHPLLNALFKGLTL